MGTYFTCFVGLLVPFMPWSKVVFVSFSVVGIFLGGATPHAHCLVEDIESTTVSTIGINTYFGEMRNFRAPKNKKIFHLFLSLDQKKVLFVRVERRASSVERRARRLIEACWCVIIFLVNALSSWPPMAMTQSPPSNRPRYLPNKIAHCRAHTINNVELSAE